MQEEKQEPGAIRVEGRWEICKFHLALWDLGVWRTLRYSVWKELGSYPDLQECKWFGNWEHTHGCPEYK